MLTRSELPENPVVLTVRDPDGGHHTVTTERLRGGRLRMGCSCAAHAGQGWCRHQIELLCLRYGTIVEPTDEAEYHFEHLVMGTPLADLADDLDLALEDYAKAVQALDARRPAGLGGDALRRFADLASDVAEAATQLDQAVARFRKKLAAG